jgi:hypothetical protein
MTRYNVPDKVLLGYFKRAQEHTYYLKNCLRSDGHGNVTTRQVRAHCVRLAKKGYLKEVPSRMGGMRAWVKCSEEGFRQC